MKKSKGLMLVLSLLMAISSTCVSVFAEEDWKAQDPPLNENSEERPAEQMPEMPQGVNGQSEYEGQALDKKQAPLPPATGNYQQVPREDREALENQMQPKAEYNMPTEGKEPERMGFEVQEGVMPEEGVRPEEGMPTDQQKDYPAFEMNNRADGQFNEGMSGDMAQNEMQRENQMTQNNNKSLAQRIIDKINELFNLNIRYEDLGLENTPENNRQMMQQPMGEMPEGMMPSMPGSYNQQPGNGFPSMNDSNVDHESANTISEDVNGADYSSSADNENAVLVENKTVNLSGITVNKTGNSSSEDADFYGINAAILAENGADLTISNAEITTDGTHANAVFSYGNGTSVTISDSTITTSGNNSGGLMTTGGATLNASNLTVSTSGNSSAAIRSDRGGGTVTVSEGTYASSGVGSPAIYSTADISVSSATLSSEKSEAVVIEGGNSVNLTDCNVTGNNAVLNGQSTLATNVLIYQSMSGDAAEGNSDFSMTNGSLTALSGAMFHVTNTTTTITLNNVDLNYASDSNVFLDASADSWGTSGKNGGNVTLKLIDQNIVGAIICDSVSSVNLIIDDGSSWTLSCDSYVTSVSGDLSNINLNGYKLYINGVEYQA